MSKYTIVYSVVKDEDAGDYRVNESLDGEFINQFHKMWTEEQAKTVQREKQIARYSKWKVTKKNVNKAILEVTGYDADLHKDGGFYYFGGDGVGLFDSGCTWFDTLTHPNITIESFVEEYEDRMMKVEADRGRSFHELVSELNAGVEELHRYLAAKEDFDTKYIVFENSLDCGDHLFRVVNVRTGFLGFIRVEDERYTFTSDILGLLELDSNLEMVQAKEAIAKFHIDNCEQLHTARQTEGSTQ